MEQRKIRNFLIVTNAAKDKDFVLTKQVIHYIKEKQGSAELVSGNEDYDIPFQIEKDADYECAIVLGGDGTMLKAAAGLCKHGIPMIGINLGIVGFLTEIEPEHISTMIEKLMTGVYEIEERMHISGTIYRAGQQTFTGNALNDIVVSRTEFPHIICLKIFVNGNLLDIYEADGVIAATPTGSTGYNLSAGGPLVSPKTSLIIVTPIAPHSLTSKSIAFSSEDEIVIELADIRKVKKAEALVTVDGKAGIELCAGDRLVIQQADTVTKLMKLYDVSFFEVLKRKAERKIND